jgi:hypothetical protein
VAALSAVLSKPDLENMAKLLQCFDISDSLDNQTGRSRPLIDTLDAAAAESHTSAIYRCVLEHLPHENIHQTVHNRPIQGRPDCLFRAPELTGHAEQTVAAPDRPSIFPLGDVPHRAQPGAKPAATATFGIHLEEPAEELSDNPWSCETGQRAKRRPWWPVVSRFGKGLAFRTRGDFTSKRLGLRQFACCRVTR